MEMARPSNLEHPLARLRALVPGLTQAQFEERLVKQFPHCQRRRLGWLANHFRWASSRQMLQLQKSDPALTPVVLKSVLTRLKDLLPVMKQPSFGELVGCSGSMVQAIELQGRTLKEDLAWRIFYATGASAPDLLKLRPELRGFDGNRYDFTTYERWKDVNRLGNTVALELVEGMTKPLIAVLTAARHAMDGSDLAVRHSFLRWLTGAVKEFGLLGEIRRMRSEGRYPTFDATFLDLTFGGSDLEASHPWLGGYRTVQSQEIWSQGFRPPNADSLVKVPSKLNRRKTRG